MASIDPRRILLALERVPATAGFEFESFANQFLADEFPGLRPVGGIHDGGRDAFIHQDEADPETFIQSSVTTAWEAKIKRTVQTLRSNGHGIRSLIYCTNRDIQKDADELKKELRSQRVSLDIRDRGYFVTFANTSPARVAVSEALARQFVDPVLPIAATNSEATRASIDDEQLAAAYLQVALQDKLPSKALTKFSYEALVRYVLRGATPEQPVARAALHAAVRRVVPSGDETRVSVLTSSAIERLVKRNIIKHHKAADAFVLEYKQREEMMARLNALSASQVTLTSDATDRVRLTAAELGVNFPFDRNGVAAASLALCDHLLIEQARAAGRAFGRNLRYNPDTQSLYQHLDKLWRGGHPALAALSKLDRAQVFDLVLPVARDLLIRPSEAMRKRFRSTLDAYCLLFVLKETPDVQVALNKVLGTGSILLDTNIIIPCMAESLLPESERRMTQLLRAATSAGMRLFVVEDVLEELETHVSGALYAHTRAQARGAHNYVYGLIKALPRNAG